ncbi:MAG: methyltransferase domain-containing protein [Deltaproteobacteria bacterium]|nr:methyltransferase domain-containing protein [Deltaproteobacteria bacterium]
MDKIYSFEFLTTLFNEMAGSYDRVNYLTSFGFSHRFRRQFIDRAELHTGHAVCDLMCGRGESWQFILKRIGPQGQLVALDLSPGMFDGARQRLTRYGQHAVSVVEGNALATGLPAASMDRVLVAFGLKTLAPELRSALASELYRILRPGGVVSAIEMSEPRAWMLRPLFMWYLKQVVPILGALLLGNPANYRMLGIYTERFQGCGPVAGEMIQAGFEAQLVSYFHGCATGVVARKPLENRDCSKDTGFIQPVHDAVMRGVVDGLHVGLLATYPAPSVH